jgi:hypothetical protein
VVVAVDVSRQGDVLLALGAPRPRDADAAAPNLLISPDVAERLPVEYR